MMKHYILIPFLSVLAACAGNSENGSDYLPQRTTINVVETPGGLVAIPPACRTYDDPGALVRQENDPLPQLGCATANNLAAQIVNPADLVRGELYPDKTAPADGTQNAAAIQRYREGKAYPPVLTPAVTEGGE